MRLINTRTLNFSEFYGDNIPAYAILSHTWGAEEVTYSEWLSRDESCLAKEGYRKIDGARKQAVKDGWDWLWVDTNCIDKSSSAELTEAINSMYQWYMCSEVCYAYLVDVPSHEPQHGSLEHLTSSRWFTRGWTLQELLAPLRLTFYSKEWSRLGNKSDPEILMMISEATGIHKTYLLGSTISLASVAERMSWLSRRRTTRTEDIAYCMMGIFGINMPLLYGEGSRAFIRLQEEIIKTSHDHSLFCWSFNKDTPPDWHSILAPSPKEFEDSGEYVRKEDNERLTPYSMTNVGLSIQLPVIHTLTHPFVLLKAGLRSQRSGHRACLSVVYSSEASSPNPMLFRHSFPEGPINLEPFDASGMPHHHFYIYTGPAAVPLLGHIDTSLIRGPNVLVVMQPTDSTLLGGYPPVAFQDSDNSGLEVPYVRSPSIETYPPDMFDNTRSILRLPPIEGRSGRFNACVMSLFYPGESGQVFFLCFGCKNYGDDKSEWSCKIMAHNRLRRNERMDHILWNLFLSGDFSDRTVRCSRIFDGSLALELGTSVPFGKEQSLQIATLRGQRQKSINMVESDQDSDRDSDQDDEEDSGQDSGQDNDEEFYQDVDMYRNEDSGEEVSDVSSDRAIAGD